VIAELRDVRISPRRLRLRIGGRSRASLSAFGIYSDGAKLELSDRVTFSMADESVAVVSNETDRHGRVEGVSSGTTTAQATEPITGLHSRSVRVVVKGARRGR